MRVWPAVSVAILALGGCAVSRPDAVPPGGALYYRGGYGPTWVLVPPAPSVPRPAATPGVVYSAPATGQAAPSTLPRAATTGPQAAAARPVSPPPATISPSPTTWIGVKGIVESSSGDTLSLRLPSARTVTVNLSAMTLPARTLMLPGREVAVWGDWDGSALVARGVAVDYKG